jgi:hypothetical protein
MWKFQGSQAKTHWGSLPTSEPTCSPHLCCAIGVRSLNQHSPLVMTPSRGGRTRSSGPAVPVGAPPSLRCIFHEGSRPIRLWGGLVALGAAYSTVFLPLALVFEQTRWDGHLALVRSLARTTARALCRTSRSQSYSYLIANAFFSHPVLLLEEPHPCPMHACPLTQDLVIDMVLLLDVGVRFRTSFIDRGYEVTEPTRIAWNYARSWLIFDLLSALPFSAFGASWAERKLPVSSRNSGAGSVAVSAVLPQEWLCLLRLFSFGRCVRAVSWLFSTRFIRRHALLAVLLRVACLLYTYLLLAHYLGLGWYAHSCSDMRMDI